MQKHDRAGEPVAHYMSDDLLDLCEQAPRGEQLVVTPVVEDVGCPLCLRKLAAEGVRRGDD